MSDLTFSSPRGMDPTFFKLNRMGTLKNSMGFKFVDDLPDQCYGRDYQTLRIPLLESIKVGKEDTVVTKATSGVRLNLIPNCLINPSKEFNVWVEVNPELKYYASLDYTHIHGYTNIQVAPNILARFDRSFDLSSLDWLVELRLMR